VLNVIDGLEQLVDQSFKNENEAALVAKIVTLIVNSPLTRGKSVGVITFYRSQQQYIVKKMNEEVNRIK
jgi:superfamily I DNA and/or RNA helicase